MCDRWSVSSFDSYFAWPSHVPCACASYAASPRAYLPQVYGNGDRGERATVALWIVISMSACSVILFSQDNENTESRSCCSPNDGSRLRLVERHGRAARRTAHHHHERAVGAACASYADSPRAGASWWPTARSVDDSERSS